MTQRPGLPAWVGRHGKFVSPTAIPIGVAEAGGADHPDRGPGKDSILSDWITIGDTPRALLPMRLRSLRAVSGRVVDRRGKPVANVEIFQSGDGLEQTSTRSDADGRFVLDGFREGPVFVFARGDGFRFHGQLIREGAHDVKVELRRGSEPPLREMRMLAEPVPLEECRVMARRLVEPVWKVVLEKGDDRTKSAALLALVNADPRGVLEKLESAKFVNKGLEFRIQAAVAAALAETDVEEASAVAESIADPAERAGSLMAVVDALPAAQRPKKLALLDLALVHARAAIEPAQRLRRIGGGAERLYELGEVERAKVLFAEGLQLANQIKVGNVYPRAYFAAQLARVDPPAALAIAKEFKGARPGGSFRVDLGLRMIDRDPAEALWFWQETHGVRGVGIRAILGKLPMGDPARAKRFFEKLQLTHATGLRADFYAFMALGLKASDEPASRGALEEVVRAVDELLRERPEQLQEPLSDLLPVVERIDPGVVPELFWRYVASRPGFVNPRTIRNYSPSVLIRQLARYDGEVAAALFETIRARIERTDDRELATWFSEFEAWSSFDPRGAVARLERLPVRPDPRSSDPRLRVASLLGLSQGERLRRIWPE
jgi:Carboxypeptidase regulatory-like domain